MGIYRYWHGDVEFAATYNYFPAEPSAGNRYESVEIVAVDAVSYREGPDRIIHLLDNPAVVLAFDSLEELFMLDKSYVEKREKEALNEHKMAYNY